MSNINEWLSVDMIEGEGNYNVTLTASAYNGANNRTTRLAVIGNNKTKYVNVIQLKEGDVEIPTDVENCFYVSPTTIAGTEVMFKDNENATEGGFYYYVNNEWREVQVNTPITINKRTYFKNLNRVPLQVDGGQIWGSFSLKGLCNVGGNIETLLGEMGEYYAIGLFADSDIVDASNLLLPATTLSYGCYRAMFYGNKYLIKTPTLPATTLNQYCYYGMFYGCSSLVTAPTLPSLSLRNAAYAYMFANCENLVNAPQLPATWVAQYAYESMFQNCKSLIVAPSLPTTELTPYCYFRMFKGCSSLSTPPSLSATTLAEYCYAEMFVGCTSLINAPTLPATTLTDYCYSAMFGGCINLETAPVLEAMELKKSCYWMMFQDCPKINYIKMLATTLYGVEGDDDFSLREWVDGVAEYGTFVKHPDMDSLTRGINGIPTLWNVEDDERYIEFSLSANEIDLINNWSSSVSVTSNANWRVETSDWITLSQTEGEGNATLTITADDINNPSQNRSGYIKFYNGDNLLGEVVVNQIILYVNVDVENIDMTDNLTATINVTSNTNWSVEYNSDWFSVSPISGNGDGVVTVTANAYNDIDREANIDFYINGEIVDSVRVYQVYIEIPTDIENCFYVEPLTAEGTTITKIYAGDGSYFQNGVWNELTSTITIIKKTYLKNLTKNYTFHKLSLKGSCNVGGNIETLLGEMKEDYAYNLFNECDIVDASNLILPATTLADSCYAFMFSNCTSLVNAPILPSTTLAIGCYDGMFSECTSLTTAPELPATTLAIGCYYGMFENCTSLVTAPELPATELANSCYTDMFDGCISLTTAPELPATTLAKKCYYSMFTDCSLLTTAPQLPATELAEGCYDIMFFNCTSLINAPELPATTLAKDCYNSMFANCTSLVIAPELPATELAESCYNNMFNGCSSLTTAPQLPATTLAPYCYRNMFNWTKLTTAPVLPATTLAEGCYYSMFVNCPSLNNITMLATDISADSCLENWVRNVPNTGIFYKNPNMNDLPTGIDGIPEGWEVRDYEG